MSKFGKELIQSMTEAVEHAEGKAAASLTPPPRPIRKPSQNAPARSKTR
jgi:hypothetical protein